MDTLTKKRYAEFDYISRYIDVPYYYDIKSKKEVFGIIKPMLKDNSWVAHKVIQDDNLDALALTSYNNPTLWWVIAFFNDISDPFIDLKEHFDIIKIPNITGIVFGDLR